MDRACQPSEGSSKAKQVCLQRGIQMQNQLAVAPRRPRGPRCDWQGRAQRRRLAAKSVGGSVQGRSCQGQEGGRQAGVRPREKESKEQGQARSVCLSAKPILRAGRQGGKPLFGRKNHRDAGKESPACPLSLGGRGEQGWLADQCAVRPRRSGPGSLSARAQAARRLPPTSSEPGRGGGEEKDAALLAGHRTGTEAKATPAAWLGVLGLVPRCLSRVNPAHWLRGRPIGLEGEEQAGFALVAEGSCGRRLVQVQAQAQARRCVRASGSATLSEGRAARRGLLGGGC